MSVNVDGGSGNDRLAGSDLADALYGGKGRDRVRGNGGDDALRDGRLRPLEPFDQFEGRFFVTLAGEAIPVQAEHDAFDGGAETDTLGYEGRRRGVAADLARMDRHAGARGEADALRGLEGVVGGNGDDRLLGDDAANGLDGGEGDDLLVGRAGDDGLELGAGSNRARGGAGDDLIGILGPARQLDRQRVSCGLGRDLVDDLWVHDFAEDDCETLVTLETHAIQSLLRPGGGDDPEPRRKPRSPCISTAAAAVSCAAIAPC